MLESNRKFVCNISIGGEAFNCLGSETLDALFLMRPDHFVTQRW
jgi:hypothetical protein